LTFFPPCDRLLLKKHRWRRVPIGTAPKRAGDGESPVLPTNGKITPEQRKKV
jgi:hypothetical protein